MPKIWPNWYPNIYLNCGKTTNTSTNYIYESCYLNMWLCLSSMRNVQTDQNWSQLNNNTGLRSVKLCKNEEKRWCSNVKNWFLSIQEFTGQIYNYIIMHNKWCGKKFQTYLDWGKVQTHKLYYWHSYLNVFFVNIFLNLDLL